MMPMRFAMPCQFTIYDLRFTREILSIYDLRVRPAREDARPIRIDRLS